MPKQLRLYSKDVAALIELLKEAPKTPQNDRLHKKLSALEEKEDAWEIYRRLRNH